MKNLENKKNAMWLIDNFIELAKYSLLKHEETKNEFYKTKATWFANEAKVLKDLLVGYK